VGGFATNNPALGRVARAIRLGGEPKPTAFLLLLI
jgi:hypothetical protein